MKIILLMAITADGIIARDSAQLVDWSGKRDKQYFVEVTKKAGVMIMGSKTYDTIGKTLPGRKSVVMTRDASRVSTDENLLFTSRTPKQIIRQLQNEGYRQAALIGGAMVNSLFVKENLVDEIHLTVVPVLFGKGLTLFKDQLDVPLQLLDVLKLSQTHVLLKYRVDKQNSAAENKME